MSTVGASPRMRGTVTPMPAHAGGRPVHPRACGERGGTGDFGDLRSGASPRMRGTVRGTDQPRPDRRCIPAHAGNGPSLAGDLELLTVHPRACGERTPGLGTPSPSRGASPRMRGTAVGQRNDDLGRRCIPAHAGNGKDRQSAGRSCPVHPRACGERRTGAGAATLVYGASPRMRGTVSAWLMVEFAARCIPAHAGNGG